MNADIQRSTFPREKLVFLLIKAEEDVVGELDAKKATEKLNTCLQEAPENFDVLKTELIKQGFVVVPKKLGEQLG